MQVTIEVPEDLVPLLAADSGSLTRTALESLALQGIREGRITVPQCRRLLGISSRYEMDGFLKSHGVLMPISLQDVVRDADTALSFRNR